MLLLVSIATASVAAAEGLTQPADVDATSAAAPNPPALQNDCGTGADAGSTYATATPLSLPKVNCTGDLLIAVDTADYYQFFASYGTDITASMTPASGSNFDVCVYPPTENFAVTCSLNGAGITDSFTYTATSSGQWRIAVIFRSQVGDRYTMSVSKTPGQNDCGTGDDAGGSFSSAAPIALPKTDCAAGLEPPGDPEDWYQFPVTSGQTITASMTNNPSSDFDICLYNPSGVLIGNCAFSGVGGTASLSSNATVSGNYRLQVKRFSGTGSYTMTVALQNDCGTGSDAGGSHATAALITLPKSNCTGSLTPIADEEDWYQFTVTTGQTILASLANNPSSQYEICLYTPTGGLIDCNFPSAGGSGSVVHGAPTTGNYRAQVKLWSGTGSYTVSVSVSSPPPPNDCGTGGDAGGSHATAALITLPKTNCTGALIPSTDAEDWYQFAVTSGQTINASMTDNASSDYDICIYHPSGPLIAGCTIGKPGGAETLTHTAGTTGNYRLRVLIWSGTGSYTMSVSASGGGGGGGSVTIRDDDNERDTFVDFDYSDDVATKRLNVTSTQLSGKTTATLWIYGQSYACTGSGDRFRLKAPNGSTIDDFNPCNEWSSAIYSWKAFSVPISWIFAGTNSFSFQWLSGDWSERGVNLGIDADRDFGRTDAENNGTNVNGELMWYLVLS